MDILGVDKIMTNENIWGFHFLLADRRNKSFNL